MELDHTVSPDILGFPLAAQWNYDNISSQATLEHLQMDSNMAWLLCSLLSSMLWVIYIAFYNSRVIGYFVTKLVSRLSMKGAYFKIGSLTINPIAGKIMFRDVVYICFDYSLRIQDGYFIFRWWRTYVPKDVSEDLSHSDTRLSVMLNGLELHIYNRSELYSQIEKIFGLKPSILVPTDSMSAEESSKLREEAMNLENERKNSHSLTKKNKKKIKTEAMTATSWRDLIPVIKIDICSGRFVFGNRLTPTTLSICVEEAHCMYSTKPAVSPLDRFMHFVKAKADNAKILLAPSPKYTGLVDDPPRYMGEGFVVMMSNLVELYFYMDEPGIVPQEPVLLTLANGDVVEAAPPVWGIDVKCGKGTDFSYGPWADRQREHLFKFFFPPDWQTMDITQPPQPGEKRQYQSFEFSLSTLNEATIDVLFSKNKETNAMHVTIGPGSYLEITMPWITLQDGFTTKISGQLLHVEATTSLQYRSLAKCETLEFKVRVHYPLRWNGHQDWSINLTGCKATAYLVYAHTHFFQDLVEDWGSKARPDILTFVPYTLKFCILLKEFELVLLCNEFNWIDCSSTNQENNHLAICGDLFDLSFNLPFDDYLPATIPLRFWIHGEGLDLSLYLPEISTSRPIVMALDENMRILTRDGSVKKRSELITKKWRKDCQRSTGWLDCWSVPIVALSIQYIYHPIPPLGPDPQADITTPEKEEILLSPMRIPKLKSPAMKWTPQTSDAQQFDPTSLPPDKVSVDIEIGSSILIAYGTVLRNFINLKENIFGEDEAFTDMGTSNSKSSVLNLPTNQQVKLLSTQQLPDGSGGTATATTTSSNSASNKDETAKSMSEISLAAAEEKAKRFDPRIFRPLEVIVSLTIHDIQAHLIKNCNENDPPCPVVLIERLGFEMRKRFFETELQILVSPSFLISSDHVVRPNKDRHLRQGHLLLSALQVRGHAMFSNEGRNLDDETLEYAWLLEVQLGKISGKLTLPQLCHVVTGLETLALLAVDSENELRPPKPLRNCHHGVLSMSCLQSKEETKYRCPSSEDIKYRMTRVAIDVIDLYLIENGTALHTWISPIRIATCNLHGQKVKSGVTGLISTILIRDFVSTSGHFHNVNVGYAGGVGGVGGVGGATTNLHGNTNTTGSGRSGKLHHQSSKSDDCNASTKKEDLNDKQQQQQRQIVTDENYSTSAALKFKRESEYYRRGSRDKDKDITDGGEKGVGLGASIRRSRESEYLIGCGVAGGSGGGGGGSSQNHRRTINSGNSTISAASDEIPHQPIPVTKSSSTKDTKYIDLEPWLEVGSLSLGPIIVESGSALPIPEHCLHLVQHNYLKLHDKRSKRLWFLWSNGIEFARCGCTGGCAFFGINTNGMKFFKPSSQDIQDGINVARYQIHTNSKEYGFGQSLLHEGQLVFHTPPYSLQQVSLQEYHENIGKANIRISSTATSTVTATTGTVTSVSTTTTTTAATTISTAAAGTGISSGPASAGPTISDFVTFIEQQKSPVTGHKLSSPLPNESSPQHHQYQQQQQQQQQLHNHHRQLTTKIPSSDGGTIDRQSYPKLKSKENAGGSGGESLPSVGNSSPGTLERKNRRFSYGYSRQNATHEVPYARLLDSPSRQQLHVSNKGGIGVGGKKSSIDQKDVSPTPSLRHNQDGIGAPYARSLQIPIAASKSSVSDSKLTDELCQQRSELSLPQEISYSASPINQTLESDSDLSLSPKVISEDEIMREVQRTISLTSENPSEAFFSADEDVHTSRSSSLRTADRILLHNPKKRFASDLSIGGQNVLEGKLATHRSDYEIHSPEHRSIAKRPQSTAELSQQNQDDRRIHGFVTPQRKICSVSPRPEFRHYKPVYDVESQESSSDTPSLSSNSFISAVSSQEDITLVNLHMQVNKPIIDSPLLMASYVTHLPQVRCANWSNCCLPFGADSFSTPQFQQNEDGTLVYIGSKLLPHFDTYSNWREVKIVSRNETSTASATGGGSSKSGGAGAGIHTSSTPSTSASTATGVGAAGGINNQFHSVPRPHPWDPSVLLRNNEANKHNDDNEFLTGQSDTVTRNSIVVRVKGQVEIMMTPLLLEGLQRMIEVVIPTLATLHPLTVVNSLHASCINKVVAANILKRDQSLSYWSQVHSNSKRSTAERNLQGPGGPILTDVYEESITTQLQGLVIVQKINVSLIQSSVVEEVISFAALDNIQDLSCASLLAVSFDGITSRFHLGKTTKASMHTVYTQPTVRSNGLKKGRIIKGTRALLSQLSSQSRADNVPGEPILIETSEKQQEELVITLDISKSHAQLRRLSNERCTTEDSQAIITAIPSHKSRAMFECMTLNGEPSTNDQISLGFIMFECGLEGIATKIIKRSQFEKSENSENSMKPPTSSTAGGGGGSGGNGGVSNNTIVINDENEVTINIEPINSSSYTGPTSSQLPTIGGTGSGTTQTLQQQQQSVTINPSTSSSTSAPVAAPTTAAAPVSTISAPSQSSLIGGGIDGIHAVHSALVTKSNETLSKFIVKKPGTPKANTPREKILGSAELKIKDIKEIKDKIRFSFKPSDLSEQQQKQSSQSKIQYPHHQPSDELNSSSRDSSIKHQPPGQSTNGINNGASKAIVSLSNNNARTSSCVIDLKTVWFNFAAPPRAPITRKIDFTRLDWNLLSTASPAITAWMNPSNRFAIKLVAMMKAMHLRRTAVAACLMADGLEIQGIQKHVKSRYSGKYTPLAKTLQEDPSCQLCTMMQKLALHETIEKIESVLRQEDLPQLLTLRQGVIVLSRQWKNMLYNPMLFEHQYKNKLSRPINITYNVPHDEDADDDADITEVCNNTSASTAGLAEHQPLISANDCDESEERTMLLSNAQGSTYKDKNVCCGDGDISISLPKLCDSANSSPNSSSIRNKISTTTAASHLKSLLPPTQPQPPPQQLIPPASQLLAGQSSRSSMQMFPIISGLVDKQNIEIEYGTLQNPSIPSYYSSTTSLNKAWSPPPNQKEDLYSWMAKAHQTKAPKNKNIETKRPVSPPRTIFGGIVSGSGGAAVGGGVSAAAAAINGIAAGLNGGVMQDSVRLLDAHLIFEPILTCLGVMPKQMINNISNSDVSSLDSLGTNLSLVCTFEIMRIDIVVSETGDKKPKGTSTTTRTGGVGGSGGVGVGRKSGKFPTVILPEDTPAFLCEKVGVELEVTKITNGFPEDIRPNMLYISRGQLKNHTSTVINFSLNVRYISQQVNMPLLRLLHQITNMYQNVKDAQNELRDEPGGSGAGGIVGAGVNGGGRAGSSVGVVDNSKRNIPTKDESSLASEINDATLMGSIHDGTHLENTLLDECYDKFNESYQLGHSVSRTRMPTLGPLIPLTPSPSTRNRPQSFAQKLKSTGKSVKGKLGYTNLTETISSPIKKSPTSSTFEQYMLQKSSSEHKNSITGASSAFGDFPGQRTSLSNLGAPVISTNMPVCWKTMLHLLDLYATQPETKTVSQRISISPEGGGAGDGGGIHNKPSTIKKMHHLHHEEDTTADGGIPVTNRGSPIPTTDTAGQVPPITRESIIGQSLSSTSGTSERTRLVVFGVAKIQKTRLLATLSGLKLEAEISALHSSATWRKKSRPASLECSHTGQIGRAMIVLLEGVAPNQQTVVKVTFGKSQTLYSSISRRAKDKNSGLLSIGPVNVDIPQHPVALHGMMTRSSKQLSSTLQELRVARSSTRMSRQNEEPDSPTHYHQKEKSGQLNAGAATATAATMTTSSTSTATDKAKKSNYNSLPKSSMSNAVSTAQQQQQHPSGLLQPLVMQFNIILQSLSVTAALLPSLQAQYKMDHVSSAGVSGSKAKFTIDLPNHSLSFTTKIQATEANLPSEACIALPPIHVAAEYIQENAPQDVPIDGVVLRQGGYVSAAAEIGDFERCLTTDLLNHLVFVQKVFMREVNEVVQKVYGGEKPVPLWLDDSEDNSGGSNGSSIKRILFSLNIKVKRIQLTATTPCSSAVRFETGALELHLSNRVKNMADVANAKLFGKAQIDFNLSLGQIIKNVMFDEAEPEFQQYAFFNTTINLRNAFQNEMLNDDKELILITLKRPLIYIQPVAVDKAILVWLNYKNAYEYWAEKRANLNKEVLTATQQVFQKMPFGQISQHLGSNHLSTLFLQLTVEDMGICLPLNPLPLSSWPCKSYQEFESRGAVVITLENTNISACNSGSLVSTGKFYGLCLRFADDFETTLDDWKPNMNDSSIMNFCVVSEGTYEVCSRTTAAKQHYSENAKWILNVKWQMEGVDIHLDVNIGKQLSALGHTLTTLSGLEEEEATVPDSPNSDDGDQIDETLKENVNQKSKRKALENFPAFLFDPTLDSKKRSILMEQEMNEQLKIINDLRTLGATNNTVAHEERRLQELQALCYKYFRRDMIKKWKRPSMRRPTLKTTNRSQSFVAPSSSSPITYHPHLHIQQSNPQPPLSHNNELLITDNTTTEDITNNLNAIFSSTCATRSAANEDDNNYDNDEDGDGGESLNSSPTTIGAPSRTASLRLRGNHTQRVAFSDAMRQSSLPSAADYGTEFNESIDQEWPDSDLSETQMVEVDGETVQLRRKSQSQPTGGFQKQQEPNIDFVLDIKVLVNSGKCVLHTKDLHDEKLNVGSSSHGGSGGGSGGGGGSGNKHHKRERSIGTDWGSPILSRRNKEKNRLKYNAAMNTVLVDLTIFHIPGLDVKLHYDSKTIQEDISPRLSTCDPSGGGAGSIQRRIGSKRASLFAWITLQSVPEETIISPHILEFLEQTLEPIPSFKSTDILSSPNPVNIDLLQENYVTYASFPVDVIVYFHMQPSTFRFSCLPVSRVECMLQLPSLDIVFSSKRQQDESRFVDMDKSNSIGSGGTGGLSVTGCLADFNVYIFHPYGGKKPGGFKEAQFSPLADAERKDSLSINVEFVKFHLTRSRKMNFEHNASGGASCGGIASGFGFGNNSSSGLSSGGGGLAGASSSSGGGGNKNNKPGEQQSTRAVIRFSTIVDIGSASFKYDMRRLTEILAFPKAWYRRRIVRRLFLGDLSVPHATSMGTTDSMAGVGATTSTTTAAAAADLACQQNSERNPLLSTRSKLRLSLDNGMNNMSKLKESKENSTSFDSNTSPSETNQITAWETLVLFAFNFTKLNVQMNMGNVMGNVIWLTKGFISDGRLSIGSTGHKNMYIGIGLGGSALDAKGGIVGGTFELNKIDTHVHIREEPGVEPHHTVGIKLMALELRLDYMGTSVLMSRISSLNATLRDEWKCTQVESLRSSSAGQNRGGNSTQPNIILIHGDLSWDQLQFMISKSTTADILKMYSKLEEFFTQQFKSSKRVFSNLESRTLSSGINILSKKQKKIGLVSRAARGVNVVGGGGTELLANNSMMDNAAKDWNIQDARHHRHWQKPLQQAMGLILSTLGVPLPKSGTVLGGTMELHGRNISLACFHNVNFKAKSWALFSLRDPCISFATEAQQIESSSEVHVIQTLTFGLGMNAQQQQNQQNQQHQQSQYPPNSQQQQQQQTQQNHSMATVCRMSRNVIFPPQFKTLHEWFHYAFACSEIDAVDRFPILERDKETSMNSIERSRTQSNATSSSTKIQDHNHNREVIFALPSLRLHFKSEHLQGATTPEASEEKPVVECSFITEFEDHIFVTVDADAFFFLHDLITSYVKEKERLVTGQNVRSASPNPSSQSSSSSQLHHSDTSRPTSTGGDDSIGGGVGTASGSGHYHQHSNSTGSASAAAASASGSGTASSSIGLDSGNNKKLHPGKDNLQNKLNAKSISEKLEKMELDGFLKDWRRFECKTWHLEPTVRLLSWAGKSIEPYGVDYILNKLGFSHARTTIPKWLQRGFMDPLDKLEALLIVRLLYLVKDDRNSSQEPK